MFQFINDAVDRPTRELDESSPGWGGDQAQGRKCPIQGRNDSASGLVRILTVVWTPAISIHRRLQDLDLSRKVANQLHYALHSFGVLKGKDDLSLDHFWRRTLDAAMTSLQIGWPGSTDDEAGFIQLLTGHL
jgi:hypothetical protein